MRTNGPETGSGFRRRVLALVLIFALTFCSVNYVLAGFHGFDGLIGNHDGSATAAGKPCVTVVATGTDKSEFLEVGLNIDTNGHALMNMGVVLNYDAAKLVPASWKVVSQTTDSGTGKTTDHYNLASPASNGSWDEQLVLPTMGAEEPSGKTGTSWMQTAGIFIWAPR